MFGAFIGAMTRFCSKYTNLSFVTRASIYIGIYYGEMKSIRIKNIQAHITSVMTNLWKMASENPVG